MSAPATAERRQYEEKQLLVDDVMLRKLLLDVAQPGVYGIPIEESAISGDIIRSMEAPNQVSLTIHDAGSAILRSKKLQSEDGRLRAVDIELDGLTFRLVQVRKQGHDLVMTFEQIETVWMKSRKGPRKAASRAKTTRAQYILSLVRESKKGRPRIKTRIHELDKIQPIAKLTEQEREDRKSRSRRRSERDRERAPGFNSRKVAGLNERQTERVEECLIVADRERAPERAVLAMLAAMAGESDFGENLGSRGTTFQTLAIPESKLGTQAYHFLRGGNSFLAGGAIGAARDNPLWTIGTIASKVEISDASGNHYDAYVPLARRILKEWGGGGGGSGSKPASYRKQYAFKVDKDETYWDAIQRLASEVNWRAFMAGDTFRYISEEDLFKSRPRYRFSEDSDGISNIDFDWDYHKPAATATVTCRIRRWAMVPGTVVYIDGLGAASGKWLVLETRRNIFSAEATVSLKRPMREKMEPRSELVERREKDRDGRGGAGGTGKRGSIKGDISGLADDMRAFLEIMAGMTDEDIVVSSGRRVDPGSNHNDGHGADIDVGGDARSSDAAGRKGDNIAIAAMRVCGYTYRGARSALGGPVTSFSINLEWNGYSVEIGWRTLVGGNHYNHVHVGFDNRKPNRSPTARSEPL